MNWVWGKSSWRKHNFSCLQGGWCLHSCQDLKWQMKCRVSWRQVFFKSPSCGYANFSFSPKLSVSVLGCDCQAAGVSSWPVSCQQDSCSWQESVSVEHAGARGGHFPAQAKGCADNNPGCEVGNFCVSCQSSAVAWNKRASLLPW